VAGAGVGAAVGSFGSGATACFGLSLAAGAAAGAAAGFVPLDLQELAATASVTDDNTMAAILTPVRRTISFNMVRSINPNPTCELLVVSC
jgi:hypothetical protein